MERDWSGNARRLSHADRSEIERLIWGGETFETAGWQHLAEVFGLVRFDKEDLSGWTFDARLTMRFGQR